MVNHSPIHKWSYGDLNDKSIAGCHVFKTYDKAIVLVVEWNL